MEKVATVFFDGEVFRPEIPLDLEPNARYVIQIEPASSESLAPPGVDANGVGTLADILGVLAGSVEAPPDWFLEHNHYLDGTT